MSRPKGLKNKKSSIKNSPNDIEQTVKNEKKIYDLEQMVDIEECF